MHTHCQDTYRPQMCEDNVLIVSCLTHFNGQLHIGARLARIYQSLLPPLIRTKAIQSTVRLYYSFLACAEQRSAL